MDYNIEQSLTQLESSKEELVALLNENGIPSSMNESLDTLVEKASNLNTGSSSGVGLDYVANAFKKQVISSSNITIKDISPLEHTMSLRFVSPDMFANTQFTAMSGESDGWYQSASVTLEQGKTYVLDLTFSEGLQGSITNYGWFELSTWVSWKPPQNQITSNPYYFTPTSSGEYCVYISSNLVSDIKTVSASLREVKNDFSDYEVRVLSKNTFDSELLLRTPAGKETEWSYNGEYYYGLASKLTQYYSISEVNYECPLVSKFYPDTQYSFSLKGHISSSIKGDSIGFYFAYTDGSTDEPLYLNTGSNDITFSLMSAQGKSVSGLYVVQATNYTMYLKEIQCEASPVPTGYQRYQEEKQYFADPDGTIKNVKSIYPVTNISNDTDADLVCIYNQDTNKALESFNDDIIVSATEPTVTNETIWLQPLTTDTGAVDYIIEEGIDKENNIYYEKWNNGIVKLYIKQVISSQELESKGATGSSTFLNSMIISGSLNIINIIDHKIQSYCDPASRVTSYVLSEPTEIGDSCSYVIELSNDKTFVNEVQTLYVMHSIIGFWK